jgi:hypothetical protein
LWGEAREGDGREGEGRGRGGEGSMDTTSVAILGGYTASAINLPTRDLASLVYNFYS